ncbi:hypothetical protein LRAMOSA09127 [Lichtheimia ramosa]|uniref:Arrestin C-terminal-like domain-containing protein n=1 Tax=Lichtheimia ramosa TaxID=688394 RepID=A0A077WHG7_9FUNG|nr:hypothetical protein LRAMOSA09127 [Lichtheimia ramosa]
MFFTKTTPANPVKSFNLSVIPSGQDRVVAFGPGSVVNGSAVLVLDRPVNAHNIRVLFQCEQYASGSSEKTTLFNVDAYVWGQARSEGISHELSKGSHMYLFAIKLPFVNYPPSIHSSYVEHHIEYTLQAFLDVEDDHAPDCIESACVPIMYLPFVTCIPLPGSNRPQQGAKNTQTFKCENAEVEVAAELVKPAYCPGDPCTVKLTTNNRSGSKISHMDVSLVCKVTTNDETGQPNNTKHHTLQTETFFVAIPRDAKEHQSVFCFTMPDDMIPSTKHQQAGRFLEVAYEVVVSLPLSGNSHGSDTSSSPSATLWPFFGSQSVINTVSLPVLVSTVPAGFPIPSQLSQPLCTFDERPEPPSFIPNIESPLPSPSMPMISSPVGSWAGSPTMLEFDRLSPSTSISAASNDMQDIDLAGAVMQQDASGHLMVPSSPRPDNTRFSSTDDSRRKSTGSAGEGMGISVAVQ